MAWAIIEVDSGQKRIIERGFSDEQKAIERYSEIVGDGKPKSGNISITKYPD